MIRFEKKKLAVVYAILVICFFIDRSYAQTARSATDGSQSNSIITAVPFLLITPDARASGMGEAGVAIPGDVNSASINPSKLAFLNNPSGFGVSYSPWLRSLVPDVNLAYLSGYYQFGSRSTIGISFRYFSLGKIDTYDAFSGATGVYNPNEFSLDVTYARKFGEEFALATTGKFIYSNLGTWQISNAFNKASKAVAVDVSGIYRKETVFFGTDAIMGIGFNISNIGTKMSFSDRNNENFLPANLKLGGSSTFIIDDYSQVTIALDFNKLLVPTQPIYDSDGNIIAGENPNRSVPAGIFGSFSDAPGGFREELKEINIATGFEYWYDQQFAIRVGYFYENPEKGNRRYLTFGTGLKYHLFNIDFSYLAASMQKSPLANTLRFSLLFNFGKTQTKKETDKRSEN